MSEIVKLKQIIKEHASTLMCETHPEVCRLRDESYPRLEQLTLDVIFREETPVSVQTAFAELEMELAHN
jgi:hypothetical protein